jgi:hypothetical protein
MANPIQQALNMQDSKPVDDIPAKLTENEYVIPADVVLILGNGSPKDGAQALDTFVDFVRQRKPEGNTSMAKMAKGML